MLFLAILTIVNADLNRTVRPDHLRYLEECHRDGKVLLAGPFEDGTGGLVIYQNVDLTQARKLAQADPAVTSGARTLQLIPWAVLDFPNTP